jgi:hypothetical protein
MSLFAKYGECRSAVVRHRIEIAPSGDRIRNTSWGACVRACAAAAAAAAVAAVCVCVCVCVCVGVC